MDIDTQETDADKAYAAKRVGEMATEIVKMAERAGLYVGITISPAGAKDLADKDDVTLHESCYSPGYDYYRNKWIGDHEGMCADLVRYFIPRPER